MLLTYAGRLAFSMWKRWNAKAYIRTLIYLLLQGKTHYSPYHWCKIAKP